jgi:hypothetical protein
VLFFADLVLHEAARARSKMALAGGNEPTPEWIERPRSCEEKREVADLTHSVRRSAAAIPIAFTAAVMLLALSAAPAFAATSYTVERTIHVPALALVNLCNADLVALQGDEHIRVTTTTRKDGTIIVNSHFSLPNLTGQRYAPPPTVGYTGADYEQDYSYLAPPPHPNTFRIAQWTRLVPQGPAPTMYLVTVFKEVIYPDAPAVVTVDRAYLVCTQPCSHDA